MLQSLHAAWGARRVLLLGENDRMTRFMRALLEALGARPALLPFPDASALGHEALARALTSGRVCCILVPCLRALGGSLHDRLDALDTVFVEAREAGVPLVMLLSDENIYRAAHRPWAVREEDPLGGESQEGLFHALLQLLADGISRGLLGDAVHALCIRHLPCLGCGHPLTAPYDGWCRAIEAHDPLTVPHPGAQGVFLHPLDMCLGSLLLGARFLLGDTDCTGAFNLSAGPQNLMPVRTAALRLCVRCGHQRPLIETEPDDAAPFPLLDGERARRLCGAHPLIAGDDALDQLLSLLRAQLQGDTALDAALSRQAAQLLSRLRD